VNLPWHVLLAMSGTALAATTLFRVVIVDEQARVDRENNRLREEVLSSPGPETLRVASLEHPLLAADLLWLQIVQDIGRPIEGGEANYDRLQRWADVAVDLDPRYFTIYHAAAIQLMVFAKRPDAAEALLMKGRRVFPEAWELPFLLGYNAYFLHGDPESAAEWWEETTRLPNIPHFVPSLAARARFQAGDELQAIAMLESMVEFLEGPHREDAVIRLKLLRSEPRLRLYDQACLVFQERNGRRPKDGAEIYAAGLVNEPPEDLLGDPITIDEKCRAHTAQIFVREDEAAADRLGKELKTGPGP
jgi:hypothetical protein